MAGFDQGETRAETGDLDVVLVGEQPIFTDGLITALRRRWPRAVFRSARSLADGKALLTAKSADVFFVDLDLRVPGDGFEMEKLMHADARVVLACAARAEAELVNAVRMAGVHAFLCKSMPGEAFADAIFLALAGGCCFPAEKRLSVTENRVRKPLEREFQILDQLMQRKSNKEIARTLGISVATVKLHVQSVLRRTGAASRWEAVERAKDMGILPTI